jgi:flagellar biogenesis protein FliO
VRSNVIFNFSGFLMFKKKFLILCAVLVICMTAGRLLSSPDATGQSPNVGGSVQKDQSNESIEWSDYDSDSNQATENAQYKLLKQFAVAVFFVIVLGIGAYYFSRKLVPRFTAIRGKDISVVETIHLGQNRTLHMIEVGGNKKLLIGSTNTAINLIADITETVSGKSESQTME